MQPSLPNFKWPNFFHISIISNFWTLVVYRLFCLMPDSSTTSLSPIATLKNFEFLEVLDFIIVIASIAIIIIIIESHLYVTLLFSRTQLDFFTISPQDWSPLLRYLSIRFLASHGSGLKKNYLRQNHPEMYSYNKIKDYFHIWKMIRYRRMNRMPLKMN